MSGAERSLLSLAEARAARSLRRRETASARAKLPRDLVLEIVAAHPARTARGIADLAVSRGRSDLSADRVKEVLLDLERDRAVERSGGVEGRPLRWFIAPSREPFDFEIEQDEGVL